MACICSSVINPNAETLSQCDGDPNWIEVLLWLQPRRDVGLWIECCRKTCNKWRYTQDYHDPIDVPAIWYCEMNSGLYIFSVYFRCLDGSHIFNITVSFHR